MRVVPNIRKLQFSTRDVVLVIARQPARDQGITYEDMADRLRIMDAVEQDADEYLFEDADYANLVKYLRGTQFAVADPDLFEILESIIKAESAKPHLKSVVKDK